jgi:hypothetical protein
MGNTGVDVSIIVGCGSKRRGWGAIMGIGGILRDLAGSRGIGAG